MRKIPANIKKVNRLTDRIANEYKKSTPDRKKIARLASSAARALKRRKRR